MNKKNTFIELNNQNTGSSFGDNFYKNSTSGSLMFTKNEPVNIDLTERINFNEKLNQDEEKVIYQKLFKFSGFEKLKESAK